MGSHCTGGLHRGNLLGWKSLIKQDGFHPFSHHTCVLRDEMKSLASDFRGNYQWCSQAVEASSNPYMWIVTLEGWAIIPHGRHFKAVFRMTTPLHIKSVNYLPTMARVVREVKCSFCAHASTRRVIPALVGYFLTLFNLWCLQRMSVVFVHILLHFSTLHDSILCSYS